MSFKGWLEKKGKEYKKKKAYESAAEAAIKKKSDAAYYRAKEKESIKLAQQKAVVERKQELKSYKARPIGGSSWRGALASVGEGAERLQYDINSSISGSPLPAGTRKTTKVTAEPKIDLFDASLGHLFSSKPKRKRRKKKKTGKTMTIRL